MRKGALRRELRTEEQWPAAWKVTSATFRKLGSPTFTAGGRTFTTRRVTSSTWPGIAEAISRDRIGPVAHRPQNERDPLVHTELADETGIPILYAGGSSNSGSAFIKFPGQRWLRFPVRSTRQEDAIMTAVDEAGNKVARYRLVLNGASYWTTPEITVHPDQQLTDELVLAIAVSALWLRAYFRNAADGG